MIDFRLNHESNLIAGLIEDSSKLAVAQGSIEAADFDDEFYRACFVGICTLVARGSAVTYPTLAPFLKAPHRPAEAVYDVMQACLPICTSGQHVRHYTKLVKEASSLRRLATFAKGLAARVESATVGSEEAESLIGDAEATLTAIIRGNAPVEAEPLASIMDRVIANLNSGKVAGAVRSGIFDLDMLNGGFGPGDLVIMAGRPGMGKTALAVSIANHLATSEEAPRVLIFSLEMDRTSIVERLLSMQSGVPFHKSHTLQATHGDLAAIELAQQALRFAPITIYDRAALTAQQIRSTALREQARQKIGLVIVDYLQLVRVPDFKKDKRLEVEEASRMMKQVARELGCPVIALAQLSRACEMRQDKRPQLSDLRESGALEQDADQVIMVYREDYYTGGNSGQCDLIMAKHRNGPTGTVSARFDGRTMKFSTVSPRMEAQFQ